MPRIPCEVCGTPFYAKPTRIAAGYGRFCSGTCYGAQKQNRVEIACVICGERRVAKPSEVKRGAKFCGDACARASRVQTPESLAARIWSKIQKTETSWLWTGAKNSMGYGQFCLTKTPPVWKLVSHYVWWEKTGHWPEAGETILHTCDIPLCVRNDDEGTYRVRDRVLPRHGHLALGTQSDNVSDMVDKGRHRARS